jgi:hypothetical protein
VANTDKLTINERLIPDEFDTDGGDLILEGTNRHPTTELKHTYAIEQPIPEHTPQLSNTPCNVITNLTKFPTTTSHDAPDDYSQSPYLQQSPMPMMAEYHNILRDPQINKTISPHRHPQIYVISRTMTSKGMSSYTNTCPYLSLSTQQPGYHA